MATPLKQSTTVTIRLGPFLDATDGVTEEVALGSMGVEVSKNHGAFGARTSATATAHDAEGWYSCELDATDTGTLGPLIVKAHAAATHLPVWREFMVIPAHAFDSLYAAAGTDYLPTDVIQLGGVSQSGTDLKDLADAGYDPVTHKVAGVVLVDTTTTNTDMRGTDSALLASSTGSGLTAVPWNAAWDAEVESEVNDALVVLNLDHLVGTGTGIPAIPDGTYIDQIMDNGTAVYDRTTDSLQAIRDTAPLGTAMRGTDSAALASVCTEARLAELDAANVPTDIANVKTDTAATLVDTNELQTDWTNGGRLDLLVDAVKAVTDALTAASAAKLASSAGQILVCLVDTLANPHTPTTTEFQSDTITEATADHYNGRVIIFVTGALAGQATDIVDYVAVGGIGQFTTAALTEAPANNDGFVIV